MVNTSTNAKVPIIEAGAFGEKERQVRIEIIRK
jgi:hypothetical protein